MSTRRAARWFRRGWRSPSPGLLEQHFGRLVDYDFTAAMEDELDEIAAGHEQRTNWLHNFYFGEHGVPHSIAGRRSEEVVGINLEGIDARGVNSIVLFDDEHGRPVYVRVGKNGPYLERMVLGEDGEPTPQRANLSDEITPDELTLELAETLFATPQEGRVLGVDPDSGHEIVARDGRYGPYVTEVLAAATRRRRRRHTREEDQEAHRSQTAHRIAVPVDGSADTSGIMVMLSDSSSAAQAFITKVSFTKRTRCRRCRFL